MSPNLFHFLRRLSSSGLLMIRVLTATICLSLLGMPATATTFRVSNKADSGPGSLRSAIIAAQANPGSVVVFAPGMRGTIVLTSGAITINQNLTITGPGAHRLSISGNDGDRVFDVEAGAVSVSGLRIKNGFAGSSSTHGSVGGAIYVSGVGTVLTISGVVLSRNRTVDNIGGNAEGGALAVVSGGTVNVNDLTLRRNRALSSSNGAALGGGLFVDSGSTLSLIDSLVELNDAVGSPGVGGGVYNLGTFSYDASTQITGNKASTSGDNVGP